MIPREIFSILEQMVGRCFIKNGIRSGVSAVMFAGSDVIRKSMENDGL